MSLLSSLSLVECAGVEKADWSPLGGLPLVSVSLARCHLRGAALEILGEVGSLTSVNLSGTVGPNAKGLALLLKRGLPALSTLVLSDCRWVKDASLESLRVVPSLTSLNLSGCTQVTVAGLQWLQGMLLADLNLNGPIPATGNSAGGVFLAPLVGLPLTSLDLAFSFLGDGGLEMLKGMPLVDLNLRKCQKLTADLLVSHLSDMQTLRRLNLSGCDWVKADALCSLMDALPSLQITCNANVRR